MGFKIVNTGIQEKQEFLVILHFFVKKNFLFLRKKKKQNRRQRKLRKQSKPFPNLAYQNRRTKEGRAVGIQGG